MIFSINIASAEMTPDLTNRLLRFLYSVRSYWLGDTMFVGFTFAFQRICYNKLTMRIYFHKF